MTSLLKLLERNCRVSNAQLATMLGLSEEEVDEKIKELEKNNTVLGYRAIVDWEQVKEEVVTALIEVKVITKERNF